RRHYGRLSLQLIKELNLYKIPKGLQDDNVDFLSFEYETLIKHTPVEDLDWYTKVEDDLVEIFTHVLVRTKVWFDRKVQELKNNQSGSSSRDTSKHRKETHTPSSE
ncbi:hypothetical protein KI387_019432, partial [Taxus chinensis]